MLQNIMKELDTLLCHKDFIIADLRKEISALRELKSELALRLAEANDENDRLRRGLRSQEAAMDEPVV